MSKLVALDRQHSGKPHRLTDLGAWGDLDHDGKHDVEESEAIWTGIYLLEAEMRLRALKHNVFPISHGRYADRHKAANEVGADVYIAAHLNSLTGGTRSGQGGNYGAVFYDHRSAPHNGPALADAIAAQLSTIPVLGSNVRVWPSKPGDWTRNAFSTIRGLGKPIGICFEPAFMDYAPHQAALFNSEGMARIGLALAEGIHQWSTDRGKI